MGPLFEEYRLALKARGGDRGALSELVERTRHRLFALAYTELRHYDDAQDAVAGALLQICLHIGALREPEHVIPWMQSIVRREAHQRRRRVETIPLEPERADPQAEDVTSLLLRLDIAQALRRLPGQQARALRLFYLEELSVREIAVQLGGPQSALSEGRVKTWLHRGRRQLAAELKGYTPMTTDSSLTNKRARSVRPPRHSTTPASAPLRPAAILHTDLSPALLQQVSEAMRLAGFAAPSLAPDDLLDFRADQLPLRDVLSGYEALVVDEMVGGRSGLEYVLFCKAYAETVNIPITLLHSQEENALLTTACYSAGVTHLARKDDPRSIAAAFHSPPATTQGNWKSFTERARQVVCEAQKEAIGMGENCVSTEHLLLGLTREADSAGARILVEKCAVPLENIREEVSRQTPRGPGRDEGLDLMLTPRAMNIVDYSGDEARQMGHGYIGSEHLLLGMLRERDGVAGWALASLGVDLDRTRDFVRLWQKG